jgi:hypothetical protein
MKQTGKIGWLYGNSVVGVHLQIVDDNRWRMDVALLEKRKNLIQFIAKYSNITGIEELQQVIPANFPIILSVDGKGIVHKKINSSDKEHMIQLVFPNVRSEDFILQTQELDDGLSIISLARYNVVHELLNVFFARNFRIYGIILGPFALNCIWELFDNNTGLLSFENFEIVNIKGRISQITGRSEKLDSSLFQIAGEVIPSGSLIPYANAVSFFMGSIPGVSISKDLCIFHRSEYIYKKLVRITGLILLGSLFMILIVNFFLFDKYNKEYNRVNIHYKTGIELAKRVDSLRTTLTKKEELIEKNDLKTGTKFSFYADQIAASVPGSIALIKLEFNPPEKQGSQNQFKFQRNTIIIHAKCISGYILDGWMNVLRNESWIKQMEVLNYQQENYSDPGIFILKVEY